MIFDNISALLKRISHACMRAGRNPSEVELVAATKTVSIDKIQEAVDAGLRVFGENRVQEAMDKIRYFKGHPGISWHLIGTLQMNKVRKAVEVFDVIESVDSVALLERINKYAGEMGKAQKVFIQVKLSGEESKHGILPEQLSEIVRRAKELDSVKLDGLMTMPPYYEDAEKVRPYFRELRKMRDELRSAGYDVQGLSMGMSHDFEVAIEEGATHVRIGAAIFGQRVYT